MIRSDEAADGAGHAVVFEGIDRTGAPVQVVWTPGVDLAAWYRTHARGGHAPAFFVHDARPGGDPGLSGLCFPGETAIATPRVPVRAASLVPGMTAQTVDHGPQMLVWVGQRAMPGSGRSTPVEIPPGAFGNTRRLWPARQARGLYRAPRAQSLVGVREVLVPAWVLAVLGVAGAALRGAPATIRTVHLLFARHELVRAGDVACGSLFLGDLFRHRSARPVPPDPLAREVPGLFPDLDLDAGEAVQPPPVRPVLRSCEARPVRARPGGRRRRLTRPLTGFRSQDC
ncbi:Hint domain-containing protein [Rhodovulum sp. BSW8]|uniref:Hint domain-containing protein n=1 Tax=Rhodovulum sp. BSW8 TaxID=2259645 RepID=UPI0014027A49|nr:Hint domain-containing protein [Rhodovulum sp. BSW8]